MVPRMRTDGKINRIKPVSTFYNACCLCLKPDPPSFKIVPRTMIGSLLHGPALYRDLGICSSYSQKINKEKQSMAMEKFNDRSQPLTPEGPIKAFMNVDQVPYCQTILDIQHFQERNYFGYTNYPLNPRNCVQ